MILWAIGLFLFLILIGLPWINGVLDLIMAYRFSRNTNSDKTAFLLNWNAFKWGWLHNADEIVEKMPFFKKDLSEIFGIRPDDGKIT
jgi:hypothetical protein